MAEKTKPFTGNTFNKVETMRGAFESQYGAPTNDNKKVLIGMRGGKAVYGDELDAVDTTGAQYVGTYTKNQAAMNDIFKEMARSGGMYNPSSNNIRLEGTPAPTENDYKTTIRASDGQVMVGALSPDAAAMREKTTADNQFASTLARLNARPDRTSIGAAGKPEAPASPATPTSPTAPTTTKPVPTFTPQLGSATPTPSATNPALPTIFSVDEVVPDDANMFDNAPFYQADYLKSLSERNKKNKPQSFIPNFGSA